MSFTTFPYEILISNISRLHHGYATHLGQYSAEGELVGLIKRVNDHVAQCGTKRIPQRDVFTQLVTELKHYCEMGSYEEKANATFFLLGGLIHRYLRIKDEYKSYNESSINPFAYFQTKLWDPANCTLFIAIERALQLDRKSLDNLTIVTALDVFRKNMFLEVEITERRGADKLERQVKKIRYETYPHFRDDRNFRVHLDELIEHHERLASASIKDFKAISFLQSLAVDLDKETQPIENAIDGWCKVLAKKHRNFSSLSQELVEAHIAEYFHSKPEIKTIIIGLINFCYTRNKFEDTKDYESFKAILNLNNTDVNRTRICGGYLLLLNSQQLSPDLITLIKQSLGLGIDEFTDAEKLCCVDNLKNYIEDDSNPQLNYEFFRDGKGSALGELSQMSVRLNKKIAEPSAPIMSA